MMPELGDWLVSPIGCFKVQTIFDVQYLGPDTLDCMGTFYSTDGSVLRGERMVCLSEGTYWKTIKDEELLALLELRNL